MFSSFCVIDGICNNNVSINNTSGKKPYQMEINTKCQSPSAMSDITDATTFSNKKNLYFQALKALIRYQSHCFPDHLEAVVARLLEVRN